jgi:GAF domain-containing protein
MDDGQGWLTPRIAVRARVAYAARIGSATVRPSDSPQAFVAGRRTVRVLLIGSGPVVGWGVGSHDLALPGAVARALATTIDRGVVVDVVAHPTAGVRRLEKMLEAVDPARYDAIVLSATIADAVRLADPTSWAGRVSRVVERTRERGATSISWLGAQPIRSARPDDADVERIVQEHADRLNAAAREACRSSGAVFVDLWDPPHRDAERHRSPADYLFWGRQIADALAPGLEEHTDRAVAPQYKGADRVDAIERLRLEEHRSDARLENIVSTAKRTLGTDMAMFTVLDDAKQWLLASAGTREFEIPVEQSACIHTIRSSDGMVVTNATEDDRFAESVLVSGPVGLRYYAGYPVEAPDGTRIGALCVFGRAPRDVEDGDADLDVLRELALLAQRELWRWEPGAGS